MMPLVTLLEFLQTYYSNVYKFTFWSFLECLLDKANIALADAYRDEFFGKCTLRSNKEYEIIIRLRLFLEEYLNWWNERVNLSKEIDQFENLPLLILWLIQLCPIHHQYLFLIRANTG